MKKHTIEEIEVSDEEAKELENYALTSFHKSLVLQELGYKKEEADAIISKTSFILTNDLTSLKLFRVFRYDRLDQLAEALDQVNVDIINIDELQGLFFKLPQTRALTDRDVNKIRCMLAKYHPDKLKYHTFHINLANGKGLSFRIYDLNVLENLTVILKQYRTWFQKHAGWIEPQFVEIKEEIADYLSNSYNGLKPTEKGFITWYIHNRLGYQSINIEGLAFQDGFLMTGPDADPVKFTYRFTNLAEGLTPFLIEEDLFAYCEYRKNELETIKQRVSQTLLTSPANNSHKKTNYNVDDKPLNTLDDWFFTTASKEKALDALRQIDPPLITKDNRWLKAPKSKKTLATWVKYLERHDLVRHIPEKRRLVPVLNSAFKNLELGKDARTLSDSRYDQARFSEFTAIFLQ